MGDDSVKYPGYLNPFDDDEGETNTTTHDDYPNHLDPFRDDDSNQEESIHLKNVSIPVDDYDDSLNPFGDEENVDKDQETSKKHESESDVVGDSHPMNVKEDNPFGDDSNNPIESPSEPSKPVEGHECSTNDETDTANKISSTPHQQQLESLEPPKPLPRTKSLLKKELAFKRSQQEQRDHQQPSSITATDSNHQLDDNSASLNPTSITSSTSTTSIGSFQRKKNKRVAPPVPVNFKRQVSGSLDAIEEELNGIGDQLAIIDRESNICQETLRVPDATEQSELSETKAKFIELIKRKNSIIRRQKELMYRKRELKLDQIHSDIEYELRMIGNKQSEYAFSCMGYPNRPSSPEIFTYNYLSCFLSSIHKNP